MRAYDRLIHWILRPERMFQKDGEDRRIFHHFGRRFVLPDAATEARIQAFLERFLSIALPLLLVTALSCALIGSLLLILLLALWEYRGVREILAGCPGSAGQIDPEQAMGRLMSRFTLAELRGLTALLAALIVHELVRLLTTGNLEALFMGLLFTLAGYVCWVELKKR